MFSLRQNFTEREIDAIFLPLNFTKREIVLTKGAKMMDFYQINERTKVTIGLPVSFTVEDRDGALYLWRDDPISGRHLHCLCSKMSQIETAIEIYISERKAKK